MKKRTGSCIYTLVIIGVLLLLSVSCKKKDNTSNPAPARQIPVLTTSPVSNITVTTANSGGNITSDAGFTISARGVCWSTGISPTIADRKTNDGPGAGSFTSDITDLNLGTTYYVRAYATNSEGTGYGSAMVFTSISTLAIGMNYQGGKVAYIFVPGNPGYIAGQQHGLIAAPYDQSDRATWGCYGTSIGVANGTDIGTGFQNTVYIMSSCSAAGIAATLCYDLELGGYSDWFLPSKDELFQLYLKQAVIGGFTNTIYWSSSEIDPNNAWVQFFTNGDQVSEWKIGEHFVRAVRAF